MIPAIAVLRFESARRVWLPVPLFLLWPFYLLAWLCVGVTALVAWIVRRGVHRPARLAFLLAMLWQLSGTLIDVQPREGSAVYIRLI
ncbi:MAG: hypothetical protein GF330_06430 [Candidatus Eisenbacteria bacterium]|nr:hypothetical protein [Candidatus Eisenbacteria bacterium]